MDLSDDGNDGVDGQTTFMENSDVKIIISKETGLAQVFTMVMMVVVMTMLMEMVIFVAMLMTLMTLGFPSLPRNTWTRNKVMSRRWKYLLSSTEP